MVLLIQHLEKRLKEGTTISSTLRKISHDIFSKPKTETESVNWNKNKKRSRISNWYQYVGETGISWMGRVLKVYVTFRT